MSTASVPSKNPMNLVPAKKECQIANEISALYGPIPNGSTRVLCPSNRDSTVISSPTFPRSARGYQRAYDLNSASEQWRQTLASARDIGVWDMPTALWETRTHLPLPWTEHFRGLVTRLRDEPQPERDPRVRVRPPIAEPAASTAGHMQGASPYQHYRWFQVQRQTTDARQVALRKIYPRAYEHWSDDEKNEMRNRIQNGDSFDLVAHDLRRQPEAVSVAVWRHATDLAMERGIPKPEKLQLAACGTGLSEGHDSPAKATARESQTPDSVSPVYTREIPDFSDRSMGPQVPYRVYPTDDDHLHTPIRPVIVAPLQDEPAPTASYPPPIQVEANSSLASEEHDPTPCGYMQRIYRQMGQRDPNAVMHPADFPPLQPEPAEMPISVSIPDATPRRASPTAVFSMAQAVRNSLKAQGVGTKQISLIAEVLRRVQES